MKKLIIISFIISFLGIASAPFVFIYILNHGNPIMNHVVGSEGMEHMKKMGYSEEDILKHESVAYNAMINQDYFNTVYQVVFNDEPEITYYYGKKKYFGEIVQFCEKETEEDGGYSKITSKKKHDETTCIPMFKNRIID